jgi:hypothetical protein
MLSAHAWWRVRHVRLGADLSLSTLRSVVAFRFKLEDHLIALQGVSNLYMALANDAHLGTLEAILHLHGFDDAQFLTHRYSIAGCDGVADECARHGTQ